LARETAEQKPVKVKVKTDIRDGQNKETFEFTTFGRYYTKAESSYLQYEEVLEEGTIKTIVKLSSKEALILRSGAINMRMVFRLHKRLRGSYRSPYGTLEVMTNTQRMEHFFNEEEMTGQLELLYDLTMQGAKTGTYHMIITFEEDN
jgi:uncharacterized beta-barrel protein YwiB (DUF1934 family)